MGAGHFLSLLSLAVFGICVYYNNYAYLDGQLLFLGLTVGISSTLAFLLTSFLSISCLLVVLLTNTDIFSVQPLKAYKRMALAHFVQVSIIWLSLFLFFSAFLLKWTSLHRASPLDCS